MRLNKVVIAVFALCVMFATSCQKEKSVEAPIGAWTSYLTEYCLDGSAMDSYSSSGPAFFEKLDFDNLTNKCVMTINGVDYERSYSVEKNTIVVQDYVTFDLVQNTGRTLVLGVRVTGDPNAKQAFEYDRGEGMVNIYSNYTTYEGHADRCFWYMKGKTKVFCYPVVGAKYFDKLYADGHNLAFYDQIRYHFRKF